MNLVNSQLAKQALDDEDTCIVLLDAIEQENWWTKTNAIGVYLAMFGHYESFQDMSIFQNIYWTNEPENSEKIHQWFKDRLNERFKKISPTFSDFLTGIIKLLEIQERLSAGKVDGGDLKSSA